MKGKHTNVAIFVPHNGCENKCSFCNQNSIVGQTHQPNSEDIHMVIKTAINSNKCDNKNSEIAFFGGSFTALDREYMIELLNAAYLYVKDNIFKGIRISTRPDCINDDIIDILKKYKVTAIEIGAQSMDDRVLLMNNRGHSAKDVKEACKLIKKANIQLGLQMMTGLYGSNKKIDYYTANELIKLKPCTVRIYPTVVMKNTELYKLYKSGTYQPPDVIESLDICCDLINLFENNNINIIRVGLHSSMLEKDMVAGAFHPAFKEMCESRLMFEKVIVKLNMKKYNENIELHINPKNISKLVGHKKANIALFKKLGYNVSVKGDENILKDDIKIVNCR